MTDCPETRKLIQQVARETAREVGRNAGRAAARDTLVAVGIDPDDPLEAQETAAALRRVAKEENIQAIYFARRLKRTCESTRNRAAAGAGAVIFAWAAGVFDALLKKLGLG